MAAKSIDGVNSAKWDKETKMLAVVYESNHVKIHKVQKVIAGAGYDTKMARAGRKAYNELPEYCKYERMREDSYKKETIKNGRDRKCWYRIPAIN